jgi:hypothetical protein
MNKFLNRILGPSWPIFLLYFFFNIVFLLLTLYVTSVTFSYRVLLVSNLLFFCINAIAFKIQQKGIVNKNPQAFIRSVMASMMVKMFVCMIALIAYIVVNKKAINKPAVYFSVVMYFIYLIVEVSIVLKLNKQKHA